MAQINTFTLRGQVATIGRADDGITPTSCTIAWTLPDGSSEDNRVSLTDVDASGISGGRCVEVTGIVHPGGLEATSFAILPPGDCH